MLRYKLTIEYDGSGFYGWQRQNGQLSVQEVLETALYRLTGQVCLVEGSGRTDTGVHAIAQVAHVDLKPKKNGQFYKGYRLQEGLNHFILEKGVCITRVEAVALDFHARFSATQRHYLYRILYRMAPSVLRGGQCWHLSTYLDLDAMHEGISFFIGHHDFSSFRASQCQASSPLRTIEKAWVKAYEDEIHVGFSAKSFLHNQIRIMVGTLVDIGRGHRLPAFINNLLNHGDRKKAGITAPSHGLYFVKTDYAHHE